MILLETRVRPRVVRETGMTDAGEGDTGLEATVGGRGTGGVRGGDGGGDGRSS